MLLAIIIQENASQSQSQNDKDVVKTVVYALHCMRIRRALLVLVIYVCSKVCKKSAVILALHTYSQHQP